MALAAEERALRDHQARRLSHGEKFVRAEGKRRLAQMQKGDAAIMPSWVSKKAHDQTYERNRSLGTDPADLIDQTMQGVDQEPDPNIVALARHCATLLQDPQDLQHFLQCLQQHMDLSEGGDPNYTPDRPNGNNSNGMDRRRGGRDQMPNGGSSSMMPSSGAPGGNWRGAHDHRVAMDGLNRATRSLNTRDFMRRYGDLVKHIRIMG
jgi:hypothetical protein